MSGRYDPAIHHRRSIRLAGHDYSNRGGYYVTLCAKDRECLFGEVCGEDVLLSEIGCAVSETWEWLAEQYPYVVLDEFTVMPNHLHGILFIDPDRVDSETKIKPLGGIVGAFKTVSTKRANSIRNVEAWVLWQTNYYEHVIRDGDDLNRIREYIRANPSRWPDDSENPHHG